MPYAVLREYRSIFFKTNKTNNMNLLTCYMHTYQVAYIFIFVCACLLGIYLVFKPVKMLEKPKPNGIDEYLDKVHGDGLELENILINSRYGIEIQSNCSIAFPLDIKSWFVEYDGLKATIHALDQKENRYKILLDVSKVESGVYEHLTNSGIILPNDRLNS